MSDQYDSEETFGDVQPWTRGTELKEGTRIDRYQILELLGKGGMGAVYKAYDPELDRSIAIKILTVKPEEGETASRPQARLMREAQALAKLSHPNVVSVFDVGTYAEGVYIGMEYVKGKTLREWLKHEKPPRKEIIRTLSKAGRGLYAAHIEGIIHRDFKPDNVIIGDRGQVKVLDFGLARAAGTEDIAVPHTIQDSIEDSTSGEKLLSKPLTRVGAIIGTTVYMAPEHFLFQELDEKTDQFSFCVTLFEALYGKRPFPGKTSDELEENIIRGSIEIPKEAIVPEWIEEIIRKGLSVFKDNRYASMLEMLDDLEDDPEITKKKRHKKFFMGSLLSVLTAMSLGFGYYAVFRSSEFCTGAEEKVAGIWNEKSISKINQAFSDTGLSYAKDTFDRVALRFDHYLGEWENQYTETCEATRVRGEQSEEIMDLKISCLNNLLSNASALLNVFSGADNTIVSKSVQAVSSLSDFSYCNNVKALQSRIPQPRDEQTKKQVAAARARLADVAALDKTGKYRDGLELATKLQEEVIKVDYRPIQAEVQYCLGALLEKVGEYEKAEMTLYDAALSAGESKDGLLCAKAKSLLVRVVGYQQDRYEVGLSIARDAEVMLLFADGEELVRAGLLNNIGAVYTNMGEFNRALEHYRQALTIREALLGPEHPKVASSLNNMGIVFEMLSEYTKALKYYRKSLVIKEKSLGPAHPSGAYTLNNMGIMFQKQNDHDRAMEYQRKALAIWEKALGARHSLVAMSLNDIGKLYRLKGDYDKALGYYRRALKIRKQALGLEHIDVADTLQNIGRVFDEQGHDNKALVYYQNALAIEEKILGNDSHRLAWSLSLLGNVLVEQGRQKQAIEFFERLRSVYKKKTYQEEPYGRGLFGLARALVATDGDRRGAKNHAKRAMEIFRKNPKAFKKDIRELNAWWKKHHLGQWMSLAKQ